jgi:IPT/TIG domain-containing protein
MRRFAIALTVLALLMGVYACTSDAPGPTTPKGGGGQPPTDSNGLVIRLFTSNANPPEDSCTLIQAIVTRNGVSLPDGTGVAFSSNFGVFQQNNLNVISVVTQNGSAVTALCSSEPGTANVRAQVTDGGDIAVATITIVFQSVSTGGPFVTFCEPSFGSSAGGTTLNINGGRFFGSAASTRVVFTAAGVVREALVTEVVDNRITLITPSFPEAQSPSVPVEIRVTLGTNTTTPLTLSLPNCFAFGSTPTTQASITAVLPSSGTNEGNTRVSIIGSGFRAPLQVFFGNTEATVLSVAFNQIIALTPPAFGAGGNNLNAQVDVRVHLVDSGQDAILGGGFRYVVDNVITAIGPNQVRVDSTILPVVTIFGQGFQAPVAVTLAGIGASVISVSATEILVTPGLPLVTACTDVTGPTRVVNINTGDVAEGPDFFYLVQATRPSISGMSPSQGPPGTSVSFSGPNVLNADVARFGDRNAVVVGGTATAPAISQVAPLCPTGSSAGTQTPVLTVGVVLVDNLTGCASSPSSFVYTLPCVVPTPTPVPPPTITPTP